MLKSLADALAAKGYETLTPVQEAVSAPELEGIDLLVSAQTGSGKTVGFGLAIAPTLLGDEGRFGPAATPLALIIAPTRELALQVQREFQWLYGLTGAIVASCVGGMDMRTERRTLERGAHIVVGTPGRLRDHLQRGSLDMSDMRAIVLDEADEMLDLGFREDLEFILSTAPESRRTLMFSATVPPAIAGLAKNYQKPDAQRITTVTQGGQHADITYQALSVGVSDVESGIINVLRFHEAPTAMVFCNTRAMVNRLTARFANRGFSVVALSGELSQAERTHALQAMRDGRARICVATDVAARGIDLPNLDLVIHADLPTSSEALLHRSGRTGRAGRSGTSILIVPGNARKKAERLLRFAKITATWDVPPSADDVLRRDEKRLLADPMWTSEPNSDDADFIARMIEQHSVEAIANACLSLYRANRSAPEDLATPQAPKERAPFGPSGWISLSIGRDKRAEPRWLLPLLCRTGNIDKTHIGAIRVQQDETFVELALGGLDLLLKSISPEMKLEDGISVTKLDGAPDFNAGPPPRKAPFKKREPREETPAPVRHAVSERPQAVAAPAAPAEAPRKPRHRAAGPGAAKYTRTNEGWSPDAAQAAKKRAPKPRAEAPEVTETRPRPAGGPGKPKGKKPVKSGARHARPMSSASGESTHSAFKDPNKKGPSKPGKGKSFKSGGKPRGGDGPPRR